jgi:hypothetical protein
VSLRSPPQVQPAATETPNAQFERLRQRFHARLPKERRHLAALSETLGSAKGASASTFFDIRAFAHRLHGAALVFGFRGLRDGAKAVERAANSASLDANRQRRDPSVVSAMQALAIKLADEIRTGAPASTHI